jgi:hypothetical protein
MAESAPRPTNGGGELSDADLEAVVGGVPETCATVVIRGHDPWWLGYGVRPRVATPAALLALPPRAEATGPTLILRT